MKKLLFALVLGLLLVAALATVAMADNGPHGGFTATTDACAACHRAHSAKYGSNALLIMDPEALCLSCHNGTGAGTNVVDGVYTTAAGIGTEGVNGASLFAGGFTNALMATAWSGAVTANPAFNAVSRPTTSHHTLGVATATIWGSGANNTANGSMMLECTSCHNPHGNSGVSIVAGVSTKVPSYRLLRWQPQGSNGFTAPAVAVNWSGGAFPTTTFATGNTTGWLVPDNFLTNGTEWYTIGTTGAFAVGDYNAGNANNVYNLKNAAAAEATTYIPAAVNEAYFCAQCHDRYFNNSRLRNNTDVSMFCGSPLNATTPPYAGSPLFLPYQPSSTAAPIYTHPVDPVRCQPVLSATTGLITGWGDNGDSGDTTYMYRHTSGDVLRVSSDGAAAAGTGATVSRACAACHVSHGTAAVADAVATDGTNAATASLAGGSVLLRMDGRTICLRCHADSVNFTVAP
jgi:predicted CXXCH cytochrome family protein